jgi:hypothetical protein
MRKSKAKPEVCRICDPAQQQCPGHEPAVPILWCPPANAENALTHTDWARLGWRAF